MSLLNDALKRASQTQQELDTVRISLPPATPAPKPRTGLGWAIPVLVILLIFTAGALVTLGFFARKATHAPVPAPQIARAAAVPPPAHTIPPPARPVPVAPKPLAPPPATQTAAVAVSAPMPLPPMKLQGITYYNGKWQAIINGRTVYVGDSVYGFRIAAISRNHVSFVAPDGSRTLVPFGE